jgi:NADPH:quinone reductase
MGGANVTAVAGSRERAEGLRDLGAGSVVVGDEELGGPCDLVMEGVGGPALKRSVASLSSDGVVVLYGASAQEPARIGLFDFVGGLGGTIRSFGVYATDVDTFGRDLSYLARLVDEGRLVAPVGLKKGWSELGDAIEALRDRRVNGKAVLFPE